jgi:hypothetical protein
MRTSHDELEDWLDQVQELLLRGVSTAWIETEDVVRQRISSAISQHRMDFDAWLLRDHLATAFQLTDSRCTPRQSPDRGLRTKLEWSALALLARDVISGEDFEAAYVAPRALTSRPGECLPGRSLEQRE